MLLAAHWAHLVAGFQLRSQAAVQELFFGEQLVEERLEL